MKYSTVLFIFAIVVAIFQLAAIIVACYLRSSIRSYQAVWRRLRWFIGPTALLTFPVIIIHCSFKATRQWFQSLQLNAVYRLGICFTISAVVFKIVSWTHRGAGHDLCLYCLCSNGCLATLLAVLGGLDSRDFLHHRNCLTVVWVIQISFWTPTT